MPTSATATATAITSIQSPAVDSTSTGNSKSNSSASTSDLIHSNVVQSGPSSQSTHSMNNEFLCPASSSSSALPVGLSNLGNVFCSLFTVG